MHFLSAGRARNRLVNNHWTPGSHGRHCLNKRWQPFTAKIAGKGLCDDARSRAFAATGGLRPGIHAGYPWGSATARGPLTGLLAGTKHEVRASRPQITERGRPARKNECRQDARAPKRKRPEGRPRIWERGRLARNSPTHREAPSTGLEVQRVIATVTRRQTPGLQTAYGGEGPSTGLRIGRYHVTTKGREIITALCRSQHVTLQQLDAFAA